MSLALALFQIEGLYRLPDARAGSVVDETVPVLIVQQLDEDFVDNCVFLRTYMTLMIVSFNEMLKSFRPVFPLELLHQWLDLSL